MSTHCPFCRQPATHINVPQLNARRSRIYKAVCGAGVDGISADDLITEIYGAAAPPPAARTVLRVQVYEANKSLKGFNQRIVSNNCKGYRLTAEAS